MKTSFVLRPAAHWLGLWLAVAQVTACASTLHRPLKTSLEAGVNLSAPQGPLPQGITPLVYTLALALDPNRSDFSGTAKIAVRLEAEAGLIWLHGQDLEVGEGYATDATGTRHRLKYSQVTADGVARLDVTPPLPIGVSELNLRFAGSYNTALTGLYKVQAEDKPYIFTQFEPLSARRAFPCFDEPRFKTPFQVALTVPEDTTAISNTAVAGQTTLDGGHTTWTFAPTHPLPTYLTAFAVGHFDIAQAQAPINSVRPDTLPMRGVSIAGHGHQMAFAVGHAAALLEALEQYFQAPYPFDKLDLIAVPDFAAGAMENAGAITFRDWLLLLDPQHASTSQKHAYFGVTAHELSHQWFGDWTTMAWWDDLWLNESFATWMGQRTAQIVDPNGHYDWEIVEGMHNVMGLDSLSQARRIRQPCPTANDVHSAFDGITYQKGGAILNMFEHYIGPFKFAQGVRAYLQAHPYATATADDFVQALTKADGDPKTKAAFYSFLEQTGVPEIEASVVCTPGRAELVLKQRRYVPLGGAGDANGIWQVPVCWRAGLAQGIERRCVLLQEPQMQVSLGEACPAWLMPNADGVGYYLWHMPQAQLAKLTTAPLSPVERLSVAHNVQAAYAAGTLAPQAVLANVETLLTSGASRVASAAIAPWELAYMEQVDAAAQPSVARYMAATLRPRLDALSKAASALVDPDDVVLRRQLLSFLALTLHDASTRTSLLRLGERLVGWPMQNATAVAMPLAADVVDPELAALVLTVAAEVHGKPLVEHLTTLLAPEVSLAPSTRLQIVGALAAVSVPELAADMRVLALSSDVLRANEVMQLLRNHMRQPHLRAATWQFIKTHFLALKARLPEKDGGNLVALTRYFCDADMAQDARAFFAPYVHDLAGGPRAWAVAQESIGLCQAQRAEQIQGVQRYFDAVTRDFKKF